MKPHVRIISHAMLLTLFALLCYFPSHAVEISIMGRNSLVGEAVQRFNEKMVLEERDVTAIFTHGGHDKLIVMHAGGTAPDVISLDLIQGPRMYHAGMLASLEPFVRHEDWIGELSPGMMALGQWKGETMMIPFFSDNSALFVNTQRLAEAGFDPVPPGTWDEFEAIARRTSHPEDDYFGVSEIAFSDGGSFMFLWMPWVWANGGRLLDDDGESVLINDIPALEVLEFWSSLRNEYNAVREGGSRFTEGKDTFYFSGNWNVANFQRNFPELEWTTSLFPTRKMDQTPSSFVGGDLIGVSSQSEHKELAWELIQFLLTEEIQVGFFAQNGVIPVRAPMLDNEHFNREPRYMVFAEAVNVGRAPYTVSYDDLYAPLVENLNPVLTGLSPAEQALSQLESELAVIIRDGLRANE